VTDVERLHDIEQKLRCWGYLSHYPDAEHDVAWLLEQLAEQKARIAELEARLQRDSACPETWLGIHSRVRGTRLVRPDRVDGVPRARAG
jgi:hypothetical protein